MICDKVERSTTKIASPTKKHDHNVGEQATVIALLKFTTRLVDSETSLSDGSVVAPADDATAVLSPFSLFAMESQPLSFPISASPTMRSPTEAAATHELSESLTFRSNLGLLFSVLQVESPKSRDSSCVFIFCNSGYPSRLFS
ncbi:hypothetical protein TIFTF001_038694 [Ficus carica]|uniref:Uncharacterized protein n=1 Tax=Ficus carica TaxID=3494 RepID=A0AA88JA74_FICCA|nr:hypothetical protein TIFTF001_038694 [Ficus carica]